MTTFGTKALYLPAFVHACDDWEIDSNTWAKSSLARFLLWALPTFVWEKKTHRHHELCKIMTWKRMEKGLRFPLFMCWTLDWIISFLVSDGQTMTGLYMGFEIPVLMEMKKNILEVIHLDGCSLCWASQILKRKAIWIGEALSEDRSGLEDWLPAEPIFHARLTLCFVLPFLWTLWPCAGSQIKQSVHFSLACAWLTFPEGKRPLIFTGQEW